MGFVIANLLVAVVLFFAMLGAQEWAKRLGERHLRLNPQSKPAYGATEGAVFALLGLFLAFTFSGAGSRFEDRRDLIVQEANAIGTAWLRIEVLPQESRPELRRLFREYLDSRLETYRLVSEGRDFKPAFKRSSLLQQKIWSASVSAAAASGQMQGFTVLLPALNQMIDITTTRTAATRKHPPVVVYLMLGLLSLISAVFVGYGMAGVAVRSLIHTVGFAAVVGAVLYVIIDLEFPRIGLIRVDAADEILVQLRESMS